MAAAHREAAMARPAHDDGKLIGISKVDRVLNLSAPLWMRS